MNATYNLHTNKIKFFPPPGRLTPEQDKQRHACNFVWWPGQKCFAAAWSPQAVDFVESFGIEIEADDTPDNVEARAERFANYAESAEKSSDAAAEYASIATTEKRTERALSRAANEAERAEYWTRRIAAAIRHAEYKDRPDVITRRIKGLEAEYRKHERTTGKQEKTQRYSHFVFAWREKHGMEFIVENGRAYWSRDITPEEISESLKDFEQHDRPNIEHARRWMEHLATRIEYEKAYLDAVGGSELLAPKEKAPRRVAKAPDDGIKKGDTIKYKDGYYGQGKEHTAKVVSLGAHYIKVERPSDVPDYYPAVVRIMRKFCQKVTE